MSLDCKNPKNDQERSLCMCINAVDNAKRKMEEYNRLVEVYNKELQSFNNWAEYHRTWERREGDFAKYRFHGISQDFVIRWGYHGSDTNTLCSECAKRTLENGWWDDGQGMAKNAGVVNQDFRCELKPGTPLLGWHSYRDDNTRWGDWGGRKWWTCTKGGIQKTNESIEYMDAEPQYDPTGLTRIRWGIIRKPPQPPILPEGDNFQCCSIVIDNLKAGQSINISNVTQNCSQTINEKREELSASTTPPTITRTPTTIPTTTPTTTTPATTVSNDKKDGGKKDDNTVLIIGGVTIGLILLIIAFLFFIFVMS
jgi:hypothetical protein